MSAASDKYERDIANEINKINGVKASRPIMGTDYSDVKVTVNNVTTWVEVKMNHTDNLANPRFFYNSGRWQTTYTTPAAKIAVPILNSSLKAKQFVENLSNLSGIPLSKIYIPTTEAQLKNSEYAVPFSIMKKYFEQPNISNQYIISEENYNLGEIVTKHYTKGKTEPAYYMQAGDDFYRISTKNPLNLTTDIPLLSGTGDFKIRIGMRETKQWYEVQAEIKIKEMPNSEYSFKPNTRKKNPFFAL